MEDTLVLEIVLVGIFKKYKSKSDVNDLRLEIDEIINYVVEKRIKELEDEE